MNFYPNLDQFKDLSRKANLIPVYCDFLGDTETPVTCYAKIRDLGPSFLLESVTGGENMGRYSFLGSDPLQKFKIYKDRTIVTDRDGKEFTHENEGDPLGHLENYLSSLKTPEPPSDAPPFSGGAVGYVGYEYIHFIEPTVPMPEEDALELPMAYFMITETVVSFDHAKQKLSIFANAFVGDDPDSAYETACDAIRKVADRLEKPLSRKLLQLPAPKPVTEAPKSNFTKERFESAVERVKAYIHEGDVFQTVLSQRFECTYEQEPLDLYRTLRNVNPSPYMTLLECEEFGIVSASPEVHVKVKNNEVEIRPIAGTRPRGSNRDQDIAYEKDLLDDEKEKAEHLMLVDLARNDIGRVCENGTVEVPYFMEIERYSHVMHIVSQVVGKLRKDLNGFDLLRATFPAGTISGAPKVRAMQVISELEGCQRSVYSGALGYFAFDGTHDSAISIRTAVLKDNKAYFQSGAGIVADSVPTNEFVETENKAKGMLISLQQSHRLIR
jgi:anthranilate synthase component 1